MKPCFLLLAFAIIFPTIIYSQIITTIAGDGTPGFSGDGGSAALARINRPMCGHTDKWGNFYFSDAYNSRIRKIDIAGNISTFAGTGTSGSYPGDGSLATTMPVNDMSFCTGHNGELYLASAITGAYHVRKISTAGIVTTIAGTGTSGYSGDGGPAISASITCHYPATDINGNIYFMNENPTGAGSSGYLRRIEVSGIISTVAGYGLGAHTADGGPASSAAISGLYVTVDDDDNIYLSDGYCIRKIDIGGIITHFAGTHGTIGFSGDGGTATSASFYGLGALTTDAVGNVFASDYLNHCIRKINRSGIITTAAGTGGSAGFSGDGGPATSAQLNGPDYVAMLADGSFFITDVFNHRVRKVISGNNIPVFTGGEIQHINVCHDSSFNLSSTLTISDADAAQPLLWQVKMTPAHGTISTISAGITTGATVAPTGIINYTPTPGYSGIDSFRVRIDDDISVSFTTVYVHVLPGLPETSISGSDTVCVGDTVIFSSAAVGGIWSSSSAAVSVSPSGTVAGVATGVANITYTLTGPCDEHTLTRPITILPAGECPVAIKPEPNNLFIQVRPNPSDGNFTLSLPPGTEVTIAISDAAGRVVKDARVTGNTSFSLNVAPGIYFMSAYTARGVRREKLVIK